jgi:hypothetical protein
MAPTCQTTTPHPGVALDITVPTVTDASDRPFWCRTEATNAVVATAIVSIIVNPVAYQSIRPVERWLRERPRLWALLSRDSAIPLDLKVPGQLRTADPSHRAVVIGFGPTAPTVVRLLRDNGIAPTVIELNSGRLPQDDAFFGCDQTR